MKPSSVRTSNDESEDGMLSLASLQGLVAFVHASLLHSHPVNVQHLLVSVLVQPLVARIRRQPPAPGRGHGQRGGHPQADRIVAADGQRLPLRTNLGCSGRKRGIRLVKYINNARLRQVVAGVETDAANAR